MVLGMARSSRRRRLSSKSSGTRRSSFASSAGAVQASATRPGKLVSETYQTLARLSHDRVACQGSTLFLSSPLSCLCPVQTGYLRYKS